MAKSESQQYPWFFHAVPLLIILLIALHVFALVYWIYRLATDNKPQQLQHQQQQQQRTKAH